MVNRRKEEHKGEGGDVGKLRVLRRRSLVGVILGIAKGHACPTERSRVGPSRNQAF